MRDEKLPKEGCFILNLDAFTDPGTHWVAVYNNEYYDSFGLPPPKCLEKQIDWYNVRQHQNIKSSLCGLYACFYIQCRNQDITPYDICYKKLLETQKNNNLNAQLLFKKYVTKLAY